MSEIREWFRTIKVYDGKKANRFGYDEKVLSAEKTIEIIHENHSFYKELKAGRIPNEEHFWLG